MDADDFIKGLTIPGPNMRFLDYHGPAETERETGLREIRDVRDALSMLIKVSDELAKKVRRGQETPARASELMRTYLAKDLGVQMKDRGVRSNFMPGLEAVTAVLAQDLGTMENRFDASQAAKECGGGCSCS